jgi:hypothetical protein
MRRTAGTDVLFEHRSTSDPALLRAILKVRDAGGGYWWVECGGCGSSWQVPYFAVESVR